MASRTTSPYRNNIAKDQQPDRSGSANGTAIKTGASMAMEGCMP